MAKLPLKIKTARNAMHVSRACDGCRRRKTKCNGNQPCSTCQVHSDTCTFATEPDGRSKNWKLTAHRLAKTLQELKEKLKNYKMRIIQSGGHVSPTEVGSPVDGPVLLKPNSDMNSSLTSFGENLDVKASTSVEALGAIEHGVESVAPLFSNLPGTLTSEGLNLTIPLTISTCGQSQNSNVSTYDMESLSHSSLFLSPRARSSMTSFSPHTGSIRLPELDSRPAVQHLAVPCLTLPVVGCCGPPSSSSSHSETHLYSPEDSRSHSVGAYAARESVSTSLSSHETDKILVSFGDNEEPLAVRFTSTIKYAASPCITPCPQPSHSSPAGFAAGMGALTYDYAPSAGRDWNFSLPPEVRAALSQSEHDDILAKYFEARIHWQPRIISALFRSDKHSAHQYPPATHTLHYSTGLHCAVLADAGALAPAGSVLAIPYIRRCLAKAARDYIDEDCENNIRIIPAILGLVVLSQYYLAQPRGSRLAYSLIGTAGHLALTAGLHVDLSARGELESMRLERQWCYIALFNQTVELALHFGQEVTIPAPYFVPQFGSQVNVVSERERELALVMTSDTFIFTSQLFLAAYHIAGLRGALQQPVCMPAQHLELLQLPDWHGMQPSMMKAAFAWVTLQLHHSDTSGYSREKSHLAAAQLIQIASAIGKNYDAFNIPCALVHMVFSATLAVMAPEDGVKPSMSLAGKVSGVLSLAKDACHFLHSMEAAWPCARSFVNIIQARITAIQLAPSQQPPENGFSAPWMLYSGPALGSPHMLGVTFHNTNVLQNEFI